jgi:hypothetical protein
LLEYHDQIVRATDIKYRAGLIDAAVLKAEEAERDAITKEIDQLDATVMYHAEVAERQAKDGPALLAEAQQIDSEIEAQINQIAGTLERAEELTEKIQSEFQDSRSEYPRLAGSFNGQVFLIERLKHWLRGETTFLPGYGYVEVGAFKTRLAQYRKIGAAVPVFEPSKPTAISPEERRRREQEKERGQQYRTRLVPDVGVVVEPV